MARFALLALLVPALSVFAAPLPVKRQFEFALRDYDDFQISDGVGGNAEALANAVFVDPFPADLTTVSAEALDNLSAMREAAEAAETDKFNPAIEAASGAEADALQVGKIQNKVLKLTGFVQIQKIKIAQAEADGDDTADLEEKLAEEQAKLDNNIATDKASAGEPSLGVAANSGSGAVAAAPAAAADDEEKDDKEEDDEPAAAQVDVATGSGAFAGFPLRDYADFQISSGVAGNAQAKANAVFVDPLPADLTLVDATSLKNMATMRSAAESAETDLFNPAIEAASGAEADALQVGKIQNKVLKLTGLATINKIKAAQAIAAGEDPSEFQANQAEEEAKLATNVATDIASKGAASKAVV
ncbi:NAD(P)-binding protein [Mycena kentingensis (nom. inval.)]|nr:NAD(P)-binding protein [Mycena kentingensis (nom. inval.)]